MSEDNYPVTMSPFEAAPGSPGAVANRASGKPDRVGALTWYLAGAEVRSTNLNASHYRIEFLAEMSLHVLWLVTTKTTMVLVGRYATIPEAMSAAEQYQQLRENGEV